MEPKTQFYVALGAVAFLLFVIFVMAVKLRKRNKFIESLGYAHTEIFNAKNDMVFWLISYALSQATFTGIPKGSYYIGRKTEGDEIILMFAIDSKRYGLKDNAANRRAQMLFEIQHALHLRHRLRAEFVKLPIQLPKTTQEDRDGTKGAEESEYTDNVIRRGVWTHRQRSG